MSCPTADLIESIKSLHTLCHPAAEISRRLYVDQGDRAARD
jgi:hypothetical protein